MHFHRWMFSCFKTATDALTQRDVGKVPTRRKCSKCGKKQIRIETMRWITVENFDE